MVWDPVSIIIPNFNGEPILPKTLASVEEAIQVYPGEVEVIVVDDASSDGSVDLVEGHFPSVRLVRHSTNRGFSEAIHSGVAAARHQLLLLLNSDVRPDGDFLAPLVSALAEPSVFAASPLVCDPDGDPQDVSWNLQRLVRGTIKSRRWSLEHAHRLSAEKGPLKSLFASGGSVALKKDLFLQLGGFLPLYKPFYSEDMDLCTRAWMRGWQTVFVPQSRVVHDHVGTIKRFFQAKKIRTTRVRNRLFYLWLSQSGKTIILSHLPWTLFRVLTGLIKVDLTYPVALCQALAELKTVIHLRSQSKRAGVFKPLEEILAEISHSSVDPSKARR